MYEILHSNGNEFHIAASATILELIGLYCNQSKSSNLKYVELGIKFGRHICTFMERGYVIQSPGAFIASTRVWQAVALSKLR